MTTLTRLYYQDGLQPQTIGFFNSGACERAARAVYEKMGKTVHTATVHVTPFQFEQVDPGDADRVGFLMTSDLERLGATVETWCSWGARAVEVSRYVVNGFRTPYGMGGPAEPAHVLYVLRVKAQKQ